MTESTAHPRFDHVNITVADLAGAVAFFEALGLEVEGRTFVAGEFLDTVIGMTGARTEIVVLRPPGGGTGIELSTFERPDALPGQPDASANVLGIRTVAFEVANLRAAIEGLTLVGGVGEFEDAWLMAYVRGPEGIVVSLAERIG